MSRVQESDEKKAEEAQLALAKFVCYSSVPPRAFCDEDELFKGLFQTLNSNHCSSFSSLESSCLKIYAEDRKEVVETFSELDGHISLSVDTLVYEVSWARFHHYMCLSTHFINDDWKLQKWIIKYCHIYGESNNYPIDNVLKSLKDWDIEGKVLTITDGGTSDLVDVVKEELEKTTKLPMSGHLFRVQCCSDVITRMVEEGYNEISEIINKVQLLNWSKSMEPVWYLTSHKLRQALELEAMGEFSPENIGQGYDVPSEDEWAKVRSTCRIADRIYDIVEGLFEVERPTANLFLPHLQEIRAFLTQELSNSDDFAKSVAQKMLRSFNEYWKDTYLVLSIAAFMDPRYKMKFVKFSFSKLEAGDSDSKATFVLETIRKLYDGYEAKKHEKEYLLSDTNSEFEDEEDDEEDERTSRHAEKQSIKLADRLHILRDYNVSMQTANDHQYHKSDLDLYMEEPVYPWTENFSVLSWWKDNCSRFPRLSRMAQDFLAIPLSVASSYDAYYTEPRQADRTVVSVKPKLMNALMCTRSWQLGCRNEGAAYT